MRSLSMLEISPGSWRLSTSRLLLGPLRPSVLLCAACPCWRSVQGPGGCPLHACSWGHSVLQSCYAQLVHVGDHVLRNTADNFLEL